MPTKAFPVRTALLAGLLVVLGSKLVACNFPGRATSTPRINVTQAYQTVEANMTQAAARTPPSTSTPIPTESGLPTATPSPTPPPTEAPPTETLPCDRAAAGNPLDVTIPDDTRVKPGETFTKIWSLVNAGSCTWTSEYAAVWFSGEMMGAPSSVPLGRDVDPGEAVEIAVDMTAPTTPGTYQSNWKVRNASGVLFGIGPSGDSPFWVRIEVIGAPTGTPGGTAEPTTTVTVTPTPIVQSNGRALLSLDDRLDLDTNQLSAGAEADLLYHTEDQENLLLTPLTGVLLGTFGPTEPGLEDCRNALMGPAALPLNDLPIGTHLCYRTNQDRFGWARIDQLNQSDFTLELETLTWALPERSLSQQPHP